MRSETSATQTPLNITNRTLKPYKINFLYSERKEVGVGGGWVDNSSIMKKADNSERTEGRPGKISA